MIPLLLVPLIAAAASATSVKDTVKFQPVVLLHECPVAFTLRAECSTHEKALPVQQLSLRSIDALGVKLGSWDYRLDEPVAAQAHVLVMKWKTPEGGHTYSVASEAGLAGQAPPLANGRLEFRETIPPESFGITSPAAEAGGKKYIVELKVKDFHGWLPPASTRR